MSDPYIGEIRMFGGNFAPAGWALCDGRLLNIGDFDALFNLIGTTFGGDGMSTFGLPDLRGRAPIHQGSGHPVGESGGTETVTLTTGQLPVHSHPIAATNNIGNKTSPANAILAQSDAEMLFIDQGWSDDVHLNAGSLKQAGGNQPHENRQPYLCVNFILSLFGAWPPQG